MTIYSKEIKATKHLIEFYANLKESEFKKKKVKKIQRYSNQYNAICIKTLGG